MGYTAVNKENRMADHGIECLKGDVT